MACDVLSARSAYRVAWWKLPHLLCSKEAAGKFGCLADWAQWSGSSEPRVLAIWICSNVPRGALTGWRFCARWLRPETRVGASVPAWLAAIPHQQPARTVRSPVANPTCAFAAQEAGSSSESSTWIGVDSRDLIVQSTGAGLV